MNWLMKKYLELGAIVNFDPIGTINQALAAFERGEIGFGNVTVIIGAAIGFILIGLAIKFAPSMIDSFGEAWDSANSSAAKFPGLTDVIGFGPVAIILGFIVVVGLAVLLKKKY